MHRLPLHYLLPCLLAVAVFWPTLGFGLLNWDDQLHLTGNPYLATPWMFWAEPYGKLYIPVAYSVWAAVWPLCTDGSGQFVTAVPLRVLNMATHAVNVALVVAVLRTLKFGKSAAAVGAAVFAVHPIQTEAVAWVSEFRGLSAGTFSLVCMLLYLRGRWAVAAGVLALALLCKPSAVAVPVMLLGLEVVAGRWREAWPRLAPQFVLAAAVTLGMAVWIQSAADPQLAVPWHLRLLVAGDAIRHYVASVMPPWGYAADYSRTPGLAMGTTAFWWAWVVPAGLVAAAWRWKGLRVPVVLFVGALVPVLGLVPFEFQRISTVADRYAYLAMLGPALGVAMLVSRAGAHRALPESSVEAVGTRRRWWGRLAPTRSEGARQAPIVERAHVSGLRPEWGRDAPTTDGGDEECGLSEATPSGVASGGDEAGPRREWGRDAHTIDGVGGVVGTHGARQVRVVVAMVLAVGLGGLTAGREVWHWRGDEALWARAVAVSERGGGGAVVARCNLAERASVRGDKAEAKRLFEAAHRADPNRSSPMVGLAKLARDAGDAAEAERWYRLAIDRDPADPVPATDLGSLLVVGGRAAEAETVLREALARHPRYADLHLNLAGAVRAQGRTDEAVAATREALRHHPWHPRGHLLLAILTDDEAPARRALELDGTDADIPRWLGSRAMAAGRWDEAEAMYARLVTLLPGDAAGWNNLGRARVARGRVPEAVEAFERAAGLLPDNANVRENLENARQLLPAGR